MARRGGVGVFDEYKLFVNQKSSHVTATSHHTRTPFKLRPTQLLSMYSKRAVVGEMVKQTIADEIDLMPAPCWGKEQATHTQGRDVMSPLLWDKGVYVLVMGTSDLAKTFV